MNLIETLRYSLPKARCCPALARALGLGAVVVLLAAVFFRPSVSAQPAAPAGGEIEDLLKLIESGEIESLDGASDVLRRLAASQGEAADLADVNAQEQRARLEATLEAAGVDLVSRIPSVSRIPGARRVQTPPIPGVGVGAAPSRGFQKSTGLSLYDNFGWAGQSGPVSNAVNDPKVLRIQEIGGVSNVFEVDLNRIQPGVLITNIPFTISQPGNYYLLGDLTNSVNNADGIIIDVDNVTVDLMGYSLRGGFDGTGSPNSDDGIVVLGSQTNIKIRNGTVLGWDGDGINALNADFSIFTDLRVQGNEGDGLVTDFNCIINSCTAFSNGLDGLEGDDGTVIYNSSAGQNGDNGIQTSEGCVVANCASFDNESDGIDVAAGSVVRECSASDNIIFGFDIALGAMATGCTAYDNMSNGFDMASACILRDCIASLNSGNGVRVFANSYITDNKFHENDLDGIRISSTDCFVAHNQTTDNDKGGIVVTSSGALIVANTCSGNVTNYIINENSAFGPILDVTNVGDLSLVAGADHPWANFVY